MIGISFYDSFCGLRIKLALEREPRKYAIAGLLVLILLLLSQSGCTNKSSTVTGGIIQVVAGENFWSSIASQLGGAHVHVTSIVTNPNADPHEYESNTADARAFAQANYVILNGAGYDSWGQKLLGANPVSGRKVLNIAELLGRKEGDNPHFWYSPNYVEQVVDQITKDYQSLDPQDAQYFSEQRVAFEEVLSQYHQLTTSIKQTYTGAKIGSTESIFVYMADALGLDLISPRAFMNAVAQGSDPPAQAVAEFQQQIDRKQIAVLVYNKQTTTVITNNIRELAVSHGIPTVGVSETVEPPDVPFQNWQVAQLLALQRALQASH
jgi:zinc/manganese transport system substrate-binding protein